MDILMKLAAILREEFQDDSLEITEATTAAQIDSWDSVATINIIVASEAEFKIKFDTADIKSIRSVADIVRVISKKTGV